MFNFAGNVTDEKTGKSKFVMLAAEKGFWRDDKKVRYDRVTGRGLLIKRLHLHIPSIFPIFFTHVGCIKHNLKDSAKTSGKKVFLVKFENNVWMTHQHEFFHAGHGFHTVMKQAKAQPGDYRRYLVLCSVELLINPVTFKKVEEIKYLLG